MTKLSVIVPCYNTKEYLPTCVLSIINNKVKDMEIILVNDGSKDSTLDVIKEYVKKYPKLIKCVDKKNGGLSDARNVGIKEASGEYVAFIDSDDYIDNNMLEEMLKKALLGNFDIVTCDVKMIYNDHEVIVNPGYDKDLLSKEEIKSVMYNFYPAACNKIYKRELFSKVIFKKGILYEDVEFIYRMLPNVNSIGVVSGVYYNYLQRENSITYTYNERLYDLVNNFDSIFEYYENNNIFLEYKDELEYVYVRYLFATFMKRLAKTKNKKIYNDGYKYVIDKVKTRFPNYKKNKYMKCSKKGIYLKNFNKLIANMVYYIERNRTN